MKTILIVGAASMQLTLARVARKSGYRTVVVHHRSKNSARLVADVFRIVDPLDYDAVVEVAREENVDGVISNGEYHMPTVAYVSEKLGLVGNRFSVIRTLQSKIDFRDVQRQAGLYAPGHFLPTDEDDCVRRARNFRYPLLVKAVRSSGSRGVVRIDEFDEDEIRRAYRVCLTGSRNCEKIMVEEFVTMPSLTNIQVDVFVHHGEFLWDGMFSTTRSPAAPMVPMTHCYPAVLAEDQVTTIKTSITRLFKALDIRHGEYNVESYFTASGEYFIIEVNARQGGNDIPNGILLQSGVDFSRLLVTTAAGDDGYWEWLKGFARLNNHIVHHKVFSHRAGTIKGVKIGQELSGRIVKIDVKRSAWSPVRAVSCQDDEIVDVTLEFATEEEFLRDRDRMEDLLKPVVVPTRWWHPIAKTIVEAIHRRRYIPFSKKDGR